MFVDVVDSNYDAPLTIRFDLSTDSSFSNVVDSTEISHPNFDGQVELWTPSVSPVDNQQYWLTVVPSRADAFYLAVYQQTEGTALLVLREDRLYTEAPDWLMELPIPVTALKGLGPRPAWLDPNIPFATQTESDMNAVAMIDRVRQVHANGLSKPAEMALPIYVEGDSPWRKNNMAAASAQ